MAKQQEKTTDNGLVAPIDFSKYLPAGADAAKLKTTGELEPLYIPEIAFEHKFPPAVGHMWGLAELPTEDFDSYTIRLKVTAPTKGVLGTGDAQRIVDVPVGGYVRIMIGGNLRNDSEILRAASNRVSYFWAGFQVVGKLPMKKGRNDMWTYHRQLLQEPKARVGTEFEMVGDDAPKLARTNDGTVYDMRTGEVVQSTVPRAIPQQAAS